MHRRLDNDSLSSDCQRMFVTSVVQDALANTQHDASYSACKSNLHAATVASTVIVHNAMLRRRAVELVEVPCKRHGISIQPVGEYPLFSDLKLVQGEVTDVV